jgi:hypothetical protein
VAQAFLPTRRAVLAGAALLSVSGLLAESRARAGTGAGLRFLTAHQAAVVTEATARLVPGPTDDPLEMGHPGAREADVVRYVDTLLSAFDDHPARVFAGGPWSNRHTSGTDHLADFVPLEERQLLAWRSRVADLRKRVTAAVVELDSAAGGDFVGSSTVVQDKALAASTDARDVLFTLTIEGMYSVPEYGGNAGLVGWKEIAWAGDVQPVGYSAAEVERDDGIDPIALPDLPMVHEVLTALEAFGV